MQRESNKRFSKQYPFTDNGTFQNNGAQLTEAARRRLRILNNSKNVNVEKKAIGRRLKGIKR